MFKKINKILLLSLYVFIALSYSNNIQANPRHYYDFSLLPYVGTGTASHNDHDLRSFGVGASFSRHLFSITDNFSVAPRIKLGIEEVRDKFKANNVSSLAFYSNQFWLLGLKLAYLPSPRQSSTEVFISGLFGQGYSKLRQTENTETVFIEKSYDGISGDYYSIELGLRKEITEGLCFNASMIYNYYAMNQKNNASSVYGQRLTNTGKFSLTPSEIDEESKIVDFTIHQSFNAALGVSFVF